jgi:hypothetical protein
MAQRPERVIPIDGSTVSHHVIITLAIRWRAPTLPQAPIAKPLIPAFMDDDSVWVGIPERVGV